MSKLLEIFIPSLRHRRSHEDYLHQCERYYYKQQEENEQDEATN